MVENTDSCDRVLSLLRKITRSIDQRSRELIKEYGVTVPQLLIIKEVCQAEEPVSASQIAKNINLSQATVALIVEKLVKKEFLYKEKSEIDRRKTKLLATELGHRTYKNAPTLMHEKFVSSFNKLKTWEQSMILSSLERVAELVDIKEISDTASLLATDPIC